MQNFGRGMWRRVGDFERIQVPKQQQLQLLQQYLALLEYNQKKQLQNDFLNDKTTTKHAVN